MLPSSQNQLNTHKILRQIRRDFGTTLHLTWPADAEWWVKQEIDKLKLNKQMKMV